MVEFSSLIFCPWPPGFRVAGDGNSLGELERNSNQCIYWMSPESGDLTTTSNLTMVYQSRGKLWEVFLFHRPDLRCWIVFMTSGTWPSQFGCARPSTRRGEIFLQDFTASTEYSVIPWLWLIAIQDLQSPDCTIILQYTSVEYDKGAL